MHDELIEQAERWLAGDPDPADREELRALLDAGDEAELTSRFAGRLAFGTAGLRGAMGAGPHRMNTAVVRQTTAGLAEWLASQVPDARERGVVVGYDARRRSQAFSREVVGVLLARGFVVHGWDRPTPTPTTPWLLLERGAAAGVQVTASHNPRDDNGYKVYWDHGAQIVPPHDRGIAGRIDEVARGAASGIPVCPPELAETGRWRPAGDPERDGYLRGALEETPHLPPGPRTLRIVHTALHGVGKELTLALLQAAGFDQVFPVEEQAEPDGSFPTVAYPNPEDHVALELAVRKAHAVAADLVLATDPDADRLAVLLRDGDGYRLLTGNEVGILLGDFCLRHAREPKPLVAATIVSSRLLGQVAPARGARFVQTLTGFKWIMAAARRIEAEPDGPRFVYGYEEAIGYTVGRLVPDKDGITAALALCCLAQKLANEGCTLIDGLADVYEHFGSWHTAQRRRRFSGVAAATAMAAAMGAVRAAPPERVGGLPLAHLDDYLEGVHVEDGVRTPLDGPRADLLCLTYRPADGRGDLRVLLRPSGTEPKLAIYFELYDPDRAEDGQERLERLMDAWDGVDPTGA